MGAIQPSCTWGPTQVTNYRAGIQVGCLPFTWALCLPRHVSRPRLFKNRTGSPEQNKSWREGCSQEYRLGERIYLVGRASEMRREAPAPGTERHHKQVMDGSRCQVACCVSTLHPDSRMSRTDTVVTRPMANTH